MGRAPQYNEILKYIHFDLIRDPFIFTKNAERGTHLL